MAQSTQRGSQNENIWQLYSQFSYYGKRSKAHSWQWGHDKFICLWKYILMICFVLEQSNVEQVWTSD